MTMILNVPTDDLRCDLIPHGAYEIAIFPKLSFPQLLHKLWKLLKQHTGRDAFESAYHLGNRVARWKRHEQMDMILSHFHRINLNLVIQRNLFKQLFDPLLQIAPQNPFAIFGPPNQMVLRIINSMSCAFQCHAGSVSRSLKQTKTFQPCLDIESSQGCANSSPLTERGILRKFS